MNKFIALLQTGDNNEFEWSEKITIVWNNNYPSMKEVIGVSPRPKLSDNILKYALESTEPNSIKSISILDFDPLEIARQITYIDFELLRNININEFFKFNKWDNADECPTLIEFGKWHQKVYNWICAEIVSINPYSLSMSKKVIKHILHVAENLIIFQNFNALIAIMGGLENFSISRLNKSKKMKTNPVFKKLRKITSPKRNFSKIRKLCSGSNPFIPPLVIMLRDILYVQEGNDSFIKNFMNVEKMILFAKIIGNIYNITKGTYYAFTKVSFIQSYIQNYEVLTDEELEKKIKNL